MYHSHNDEALISQKISTIINCFIDSQIPPSLQIDVPSETADRILDRKHEKSPYIFREAQVGSVVETVNNVLLNVVEKIAWMIHTKSVSFKSL